MDEFTLYLLHGIFLWLPWTVFGILMLVTNRWFAYKYDKCQYVHTILGFLILIMDIAFIILIAVYDGVEFFDGWHSTLASCVTILVIMLAINGLAMYKLKQEFKWDKQDKIK